MERKDRKILSYFKGLGFSIMSETSSLNSDKITLMSVDVLLRQIFVISLLIYWEDIIIIMF